MFIQTQNSVNREYYTKLLKAAGSLTNLFSDSQEPYLNYRYVENLFCKAFNADNLSRSDTSADASKERLGIGIKTFSYRNGKSFEKIAEFNKSLSLFRNLETEMMVRKIAELRNERIETTKRVFGLDNIIYHCVARRIRGILIYEQPMNLVDTSNLNNVILDDNIINFEDGIEEYKFNISKSTLYKRFTSVQDPLDFDVNILNDPFQELDRLFSELREIVFSPIQSKEHIFLPLYSYDRVAQKKVVYPRSALNQWNAGGRPRDIGEVYIGIPSWIHTNYPTFFPNRDVKFDLKLPNKGILKAKLCQDNSKALMSDPNRALGEWLLRDVLNLQDGEVLTYEKLEQIGIDSVVIYKTSDRSYDIDFTKIGTYEDFKNNLDIEEDK